MSVWVKIVSWPLIYHMLEEKQRLLSSPGSSCKNGVNSKREFPLGINTLLNHLSVREVRQKCTQNKLRHTQMHRTYLSCCVWVKQGWVIDWGSLCPCCESSDDHWSLHPHWGILVVVFLRHTNKQTHPQKTRWWQNSWSHMWKEICRFVAASWLKNNRKTRREIIDFFLYTKDFNRNNNKLSNLATFLTSITFSFSLSETCGHIIYKYLDHSWWRTNIRMHSGTWYVVALWLNASREIGVFRDWMAVVIQNWELTGNFCMSGHQHRWENCKMDHNTEVAP